MAHGTDPVRGVGGVEEIPNVVHEALDVVPEPPLVGLHVVKDMLTAIVPVDRNADKPPVSSTAGVP